MFNEPEYAIWDTGRHDLLYLNKMNIKKPQKGFPIITLKMFLLMIRPLLFFTEK